MCLGWRSSVSVSPDGWSLGSSSFGFSACSEGLGEEEGLSLGLLSGGLGRFFLCFVIFEEGVTPLSFRVPEVAGVYSVAGMVVAVVVIVEGGFEL